MERIAITAPARLHFGLIDMNGELGRIDGGIGLALESPHTLIEAKKVEGIHAECKDEPGIVDRLEAAIRASLPKDLHEGNLAAFAIGRSAKT